MVPTEIIREAKIFKMFHDHMIEEIALIGVPVFYKANEIIFDIGERADSLSILISGRVDIMTTKRTQLIPVHTVRPKEAFAISAMMTGRFLSAAKAVEDSEICELPVYRMNKILEKDYKAAFYFMKHIALSLSTRLSKIHHKLDVTGSGYI